MVAQLDHLVFIPGAHLVFIPGAHLVLRSRRRRP